MGLGHCPEAEDLNCITSLSQLQGKFWRSFRLFELEVSCVVGVLDLDKYVTLALSHNFTTKLLYLSTAYLIFFRSQDGDISSENIDRQIILSLKIKSLNCKLDIEFFPFLLTA